LEAEHTAFATDKGVAVVETDVAGSDVACISKIRTVEWRRPVKIAIPMIEQDINAGISPSFGRAPWFLFYDTDTSESEWLRNIAADSAGGAGIRAAQAVVDIGTNALITHQCGDNAGRVLSNAKIAVYRSTGGTAKESIDALIAGDLPRLSEFHAGFHGRV
jgi:predicted Fe-Mo cluster-binding NifX family protein